MPGSASAVDARPGAGVFISVLAYFPFIYLPAAAVLRRLDPGIEDVATSLGSRPLAVFFRVVLPQLKLAVWGGSLLIALHLLAEYGLYAMIRFDTFTTAIFDQFQSTFNGPAANMLAGVLVLCCLGLLLLEALSRGRARYARVGSGSARSQTPRRLSLPLAALALLLPISLTALALGVPFITPRPLAVAGGIRGVAQRRAMARAVANAVAVRRRRVADHAVRHSDGLAVGALSGPSVPRAGGLQLRHQLAARHRGGAGHW